MTSPNPALELLRDVVQHWDAGDIDHDYDAISSAIDAARDHVQSTIGLAGEHRHPLTGDANSEAMAGECPGECGCRLYSPDADPADCGCDSYCTMDTLDWPKWSADAAVPS